MSKVYSTSARKPLVLRTARARGGESIAGVMISAILKTCPHTPPHLNERPLS